METRNACFNLARQHLGIENAETTRISACHRLRQEANAPLIIRFSDLDDRDRWLRNARNLRGHPDKVSITPDVSPAIRPMKKDILNQRRQLPQHIKQKATVKHLKSWPFFELVADGQRQAVPSMSKNDIMKTYTGVSHLMKFEL